MIVVRLLAGETVVRETMLREGSLLIGRGPQSDFVIADPSVSRQHALVRLDQGGTAWIEDAGSRNGLRVGGARVERAAVTAAAPLRCELGAAELELAVWSLDDTMDLSAPAAAARSPWPRSLPALGLWAAGVAASLALMVVEPGFWSPWFQERASMLSLGALGAAVGVPVLAFILIGILRIVGRRARLSDALRALAVVSWGWVLLGLLTRAAQYGLSVAAHTALETVVGSLGGVVTLAYLASVAHTGRRGRFFLTWVAGAGALAVASHAANRLVARQSGVPQVDYDVAVPLAGATGPARELDPYLEDVRATFGKAAERARDERLRSRAARP